MVGRRTEVTLLKRNASVCVKPTTTEPRTYGMTKKNDATPEDLATPELCRVQQRQTLAAALLSREAAARDQEQAAGALDERVFSGQFEGCVVEGPGGVEVL